MAPDTGAYAFEGVDADKLHEVHQTFTGFLFDALGQNPRWSQTFAIANDLATRGNTAKAKMASRSHGVHEWKDEREKSKVTHYDQTVEIKRWANAIELDFDDLDDEDLNLGQYRMIIAEMADDFVEHRHQLFIDLISAGFAATIATAFDGQFFFDTDHPLDDGSTQSNTGTGVLNEANLYVGINDLAKLKKQNGKLANVRATHLIAPQALQATVDLLLGSQSRADGNGTKTNPHFNRLEPIIDPRLDDDSATAWFLADLSKPLKPFFAADRRGVTPSMSDENMFEQGTMKWGSTARYNTNYAFYQTMYGSDGTV